jgi:hypothetical protein
VTLPWRVADRGVSFEPTTVAFGRTLSARGTEIEALAENPREVTMSIVVPRGPDDGRERPSLLKVLGRILWQWAKPKLIEFGKMVAAQLLGLAILAVIAAAILCTVVGCCIWCCCLCCKARRRRREHEHVE